MVRVYPYSTSRKRSSCRITSKRPTSTSSFSTTQSKARHSPPRPSGRISHCIVLAAEYKDDSYIIPRSTSVIAKRMPAIRPGKGRAAIYVAHVGTTGNGKNEDAGASTGGGHNAHGGGVSSGGRFGAMSKRFDGRDVKPHVASAPTSSSVRSHLYQLLWHNSLNAHQGTPQPQNAPVPVAAPAGTEDEAAAIAAMFSETSEQWEQTQERMAQFVLLPIRLSRCRSSLYLNVVPFRSLSRSRPIYTRPFNNNRPQHSGGGGQQQHHRQPDSRPLPPGYICHRCNKKGGVF